MAHRAESVSIGVNVFLAEEYQEVARQMAKQEPHEEEACERHKPLLEYVRPPNFAERLHVHPHCSGSMTG